MNFNAIHGCIKCETEGIYSMKKRRLYYPVKENYVPRTDEKFRNGSYKGHCLNERSPLLALPINIIDSFVVADSLHLIDLGLMKLFLIGWRFGKFNGFKGRWTADQIIGISDILLSIKKPKEINRSIRGLQELKHWKGSEFHTFFFYISIVILVDFLPFDLYNNFLYLYCAIIICSSKYYDKNIPIASNLLHSFVKQFAIIYGTNAVTSNIHNLVHLANDVQKYGPLPTITAYPFENQLYTIKKMLRKGNEHLAQAAKRISELSVANQYKNDVNKKYPVCKVKYANKDGTLSEEFSAQVLVRKDLMFSNRCVDSWFFTKNNEIVTMEKATLIKNEVVIYGYKVTSNPSELFCKPLRSSLLHIYCLPKEYSAVTQLIPYKLSDIRCKFFPIFYKQKIVLIPLNHTLDIFN